MSCIRLESIPEHLSIMGKKLLLPQTLLLCFTACLTASEFSTAFAGGAAPQFEIDLKELDKLKGTQKQSPAKSRKEHSSKPVTRSPESSNSLNSAATYTVKSGDNLFKILMRDFGLSNREAELRIPDVMRVNNLSSSTRLTVGNKIVIPAERQTKTIERHNQNSEGKRSAHRHKPELKSAQQEADQPPIVIDTFIPVTKLPESVTATKPVLSVKSISGAIPDQTLDQFLTAISVTWSKDRVIEGSTGPGNPESFSIKVERYLELGGKRYVLTGARKNPYEYTILRLLELGGYTVIKLDDQSGFPMLASQLLTQLGFTFSSGKHRFTLPDKTAEPRVLEGFLVSLKSPRSSVFITETPLDAITVETLAASTVEAEKNILTDQK